MRLKYKQKIVEYFGMQLVVPEWVKWLAVDGDGELYGYECEPDNLVDEPWDEWYTEEGKCYRITEVVLEEHWSETLVELF
ncbi:hypothetical protein CPT_Seurat73 [Escherichia phage Seurat]|uniref:DUF5111 domain-containing protein n=1 Tax=Escherichia phage Seurat TaxID=1540098 RepID=A0A0A0RTL9_9CAUD|nr:hypothetical protein CPT_Seurat73 [Escherichia phage Seurat]AIW03936.1 hypothetical protein CPT_Seurat73 [Escherichia phage Seurat]